MQPPQTENEYSKAQGFAPMEKEPRGLGHAASMGASRESVITRLRGRANRLREYARDCEALANVIEARNDPEIEALVYAVIANAETRAF